MIAVADFLAAFNPFQALSTDEMMRRWKHSWSLGRHNDSAVNVSAKGAMKLAPYWQGVNVIAGDVGKLPLNPHRRTGDEGKDKEVFRQHQAFRVVRRQANTDTFPISATTFKETLTFHAIHYGNGCAEITRDRANRPTAFIPLLPGNNTRLVEVDNQLWYVTTVDGVDYKIQPKNVIHIKGLSWDALWGIPLWEYAANSIGLGLSQEKLQNATLKQGGRPSGVLTTDQKLNKDAADEFKERWSAMNEGLDERGRIAVLHHGAKYQPISFNNEEAQAVESRKFQRTEMASWLNLPPHKVNDLERAIQRNLEEQNGEYLNQTLMRWLTKWQDECDEKLRTNAEKDSDSVFFEFNTAALLRGTLLERYQAYRIGLGGAPFLTRNEVRRSENKNGVEGGDDILDPKNMGDDGGVNNEPTGEAEPAGGQPNNGGNAHARNAIKSRIEHLAGVECNGLLRGAAKGGNFLDYADTFYEKWGDTMATAVGKLGGSPVLGADWATASLANVLSMTDRVTAEGLQDGIKSLFNGELTERVEAMVDAIMGEAIE